MSTENKVCFKTFNLNAHLKVTEKLLVITEETGRYMTMAQLKFRMFQQKKKNPIQHINKNIKSFQPYTQINNLTSLDSVHMYKICSLAVTFCKKKLQIMLNYKLKNLLQTGDTYQ